MRNSTNLMSDFVTTLKSNQSKFKFGEEVRVLSVAARASWLFYLPNQQILINSLGLVLVDSQQIIEVRLLLRHNGLGSWFG